MFMLLWLVIQLQLKAPANFWVLPSSLNLATPFERSLYGKMDVAPQKLCTFFPTTFMFWVSFSPVAECVIVLLLESTFSDPLVAQRYYSPPLLSGVVRFLREDPASPPPPGFLF